MLRENETEAKTDLKVGAKKNLHKPGTGSFKFLRRLKYSGESLRGLFRINIKKLKLGVFVL